MLKKVLGFLVFISFFFTGCISSRKIEEKLSKPKNDGIITLFNSVILEDDIFSWNGENKGLLIRSWGIPTNVFDINSHETLMEYIMSETVENVYTEGNSVSEYNEILEKTFSKSFSNETHTRSTTESKISFYVVDDVIEEISYSGNYNQMKKICKGRSSKEYGKLAENAIGLNKIFYIYDETWFTLTTEELFMYLLPFSNYYETEYLENLYISSEESTRQVYKDYDQQKWLFHLGMAGNDLTKPSQVLSFLADIKTYRELFENENFNPSIYFKDKYTVNDFSTGKVKWNEVSLADIQPLKRYVNPSEEYLYRAKSSIRNEAMTTLINASKIKTEQDFKDYLSLMSTSQTEKTIFSYILSIEFFYELYPENLKQINEVEIINNDSKVTNHVNQSGVKYSLGDISNSIVMWNDISLQDIQALEVYASPTVLNFYKNNSEKNKVIENQMAISNVKTKQDFFNFITDFQKSGTINETTIYLFIMYIEYYYAME